MNFWNHSVFKSCLSTMSEDLHFKSICRYWLKWRSGLKAKHRITQNGNFNFSHRVGNYSCTLVSSLSNCLCSQQVANVSMYKIESERGRVQENKPYILFQSRWPRPKTFHRQCRGNVNLRLLNLAHTHAHTVKGGKKKKKTHLPFLPYTHIMH